MHRRQGSFNRPHQMGVPPFAFCVAQCALSPEERLRMQTRRIRSERVSGCWRAAALTLCCALAFMALACGGDDEEPGPTPNDERILVKTFTDLAHFTAAHVDTAALARAARAGQSLRMPFAHEGGGT